MSTSPHQNTPDQRQPSLQLPQTSSSSFDPLPSPTNNNINPDYNSPSPTSATPPRSPNLFEHPSTLSDSDRSSTHSPNEKDTDANLLNPDASCVVCFERPTNVTLKPCLHANLCDVCVSRLVKRRCPTCRARAKEVCIRKPGCVDVIKPVREIIADRKRRESRVLEDTLQVVFLGPEKVGKKTLVTKLIRHYPLPGSRPPQHTIEDLFSDGTDFSANACIGGVNVRLTVLRRTNLTSRRMILDDVRVLKPDVLVLCCSSLVRSTFDLILTWDKILRNNFQKPRVWTSLTMDDADTQSVDFEASINAIAQPDLRPRAHYYCGTGDRFSVGFNSLPKDVVTMGRVARDEELAASMALEEARSMAVHEAAGTLADHAAANLVIANNGIGVPPSPHSSHSHRAHNATSRHHGVGRSFSLRGFRDRGSHNGQGMSISNLIPGHWFQSSNE